MTTIKHLVVHAEANRSFRVRMTLAMALAKRFDATVEAVFARRAPYVPMAIDGVISPQLMEAMSEQAAQAEAKARALFDELADSKAEWLSFDGEPARAVSARARAADLAVLGQPDPDVDTVASDFAVPAEVVMHSGRPALVVPYAGTFSGGFETVLVAWNDSAEAARALKDSLPLLAGAKKILVMGVNPENRESRLGVDSAEICAYLGRHGLSAEGHDAFNETIGVGDAILSRASDFGADLIVMGAYGHGRFREMILGGATHNLMRHMTVPVLMAH